MTDNNSVEKRSLAENLLLWSARISGAVIILYSLVLIVYSLQEGDNRNTSFSPGAWDGLMIITGACLLIGIAGLITAYLMEGEGGLIALIGMAAFVVLTRYNPRAVFINRYYLLIIPAFLYLWYWWIEKKVPDTDTD